MDAEAAELAADPVRADEVRRAKKICNCKSVDLGTIEDAIRSRGLSTVDAVKEYTHASGGCGACKTRIEDILARMPTMAAPASMLQAAE